MQRGLMLAALIAVIALAAFALSQRGNSDTPGRPPPHAIDQSP